MRGRVETGVVRFNDDWPGVFIRGDDAFAISLALQDPSQHLRAVEGLVELLAGSNMAHLAENVQRLKVSRPRG